MSGNLDWFHETWISGKVFKLSHWNYHEKIDKVPELVISNNGLEGWHQMVKSQLDRIEPSFPAFLDVLRICEAVKKWEWDGKASEGLQKLWPSSGIMREAYHKCIKPENRATLKLKTDLKSIRKYFDRDMALFYFDIFNEEQSHLRSSSISNLRYDEIRTM